MALTTVESIQAVVAFPTQAWGAGSKTVGPVPIPAGIRYGALLIDLSQLQSGDMGCAISVSIDQSDDGGPTWHLGTVGFGLNLPLSGLSIVGGVLVDGNGNPVQTSWASVRFANSQNANRQIRGTASLSTGATVGCTLVIW
jgi:hypothetical protein